MDSGGELEGVGRVKKTSPRAWVGVGDVGRGGGRVETGRGSGRETDAVRGRKTTSPGAWVGGSG